MNNALTHYLQALDHCQAVGDRLMSSRVHHTLAGLHWQAGALDQALEHMQQALDISQEIGYGSGIAHGFVALSHFYAQHNEVHRARDYLREAITC